MMRPSDPRVRAGLNRLSSTLESTSQTTRTYLYSVSQHAEPYLTPCLESISSCLEASCQPCFSARDGSRRRHHPTRAGVPRGRGGRDGVFGAGFDFYDDWEREEEGWGEDELERLLSGGEDEGAGQRQPRRKVIMNYGSRLGGEGGPLSKRKVKDIGEADPNVVPQSSMFGFLESLPWKIGGRGSGRYRPSVADLQEGVGRKGAAGADAEVALLEDTDADSKGRKGRGRSGTVGSRETGNSLSSRGDLFPSDDEADAVPLDDEFEAMMLERRNTATTSDNHSNGNKHSRRSLGSRSSTKTGDSRASGPRRKEERRSSADTVEEIPTTSEEDMPNLSSMRLEEERARKEEEELIEEKRQTALKLAHERGLLGATDQAPAPSPTKDAEVQPHIKRQSIIEDASLDRQSNTDIAKVDAPALDKLQETGHHASNDTKSRNPTTEHPAQQQNPEHDILDIHKPPNESS